MLHPLTPGIALGKAGETPDSATARKERLVVSWEGEVRRGREGGRTVGEGGVEVDQNVSLLHVRRLYVQVCGYYFSSFCYLYEKERAWWGTSNNY